MESPWLPVWLVGSGDLYQLVHVCTCSEYQHNNNDFANSVVDCGVPPSVPNGSPGTPTPGTTFGGTVTYICFSGYQDSNGVTMATATCMANRMWEPVLTCTGKL